MKKKVLIISYYWPPSGGAGVQRWLKMSKQLAQQGVEVHVLTVDPKKASYFQLDPTLKNDIHPSIKVHTSHSFEPLSYYSKIVGKKNVPTAGFSNVDTTKASIQLVTKIRSRFFIPDPRVGWKKYATIKALHIIKEFGIKTIITTSPPHSVQLIGLAIKQKLKNNIKWIVDFRDPWTDIYYYPILGHSKRSHQKNAKLEIKVLENADQLVTVSEGFMNLFLQKTKAISKKDFEIISNAFDPDDFKNPSQIHPPKDRFIISYIGTVADNYNAEVLFDAIAKLIDKYPNEHIQFEATGIVSEKLKKYITSKIGAQASFFDPVPHSKAVEKMLCSHILLLITPNIEGIIPGKTFEYMASKNCIINLGKGNSSQEIEKGNFGKGFERNELNAIFEYMEMQFLNFKNKVHFQPNLQELHKNAWPYKAQLIQALID